jgi:hypothetical protein
LYTATMKKKTLSETNPYLKDSVKCQYRFPKILSLDNSI